MKNLNAFCCCQLLHLAFAFASTFADPGSIGVNYGQVADNFPTPVKIINLLKSEGLNRIKLNAADPIVLEALAGSNIKVIIGLPNKHLHRVAKYQSSANSWVQKNILRFYPSTQIHAIAVGNEVFTDPTNTTNFLIPAMKNLQAALVHYKLDSAIKISTPIPFSALQSSYPSSSGAFRTDLVQPVIKPMLEFLRQTGSYLMVNIYPFSSYKPNSDFMSIVYALFRANPGVVDSGNGFRYSNLFEAQIDAFYAAMIALNYKDLKIVVTETGWPSKGDEMEIGVSEENAAEYHRNLVRRVLSGGGTLLKPENNLEVYLFPLFNDNGKPGPTAEGFKGWRSTLINGGKAEAPGHTASGMTGAVASEISEMAALQKVLDDEGGADCRTIQPCATRNDPNRRSAEEASVRFKQRKTTRVNRGRGRYYGSATYVDPEKP